MRGFCSINCFGQYNIVARAIFLSRPARPASCTNASNEPEKLTLYVKRTFGLSIPIPNALVATIIEVSPERNLSCSVRTSPPMYRLTYLLPKLELSEEAIPTLLSVSFTPILPRRCGQNTIAAAVFGFSSYQFSFTVTCKSACSISRNIFSSVIASLAINRSFIRKILSGSYNSFKYSTPFAIMSESLSFLVL